jgi:peptide/nickel transport system permease protein
MEEEGIMLSIVRSVAQAGLLLLAVLVLNFLLIHLAPGDPAEVIAGESGGADPVVMAAIREAYGLDQPVFVQLTQYLAQVLRGDMGYSYFFNEPVLGLVLQRMGATVLLAATALAIAVTFGTLLGVLAARKPNSLLSHLVTLLALAGFSAPVFWTAMLLVIAFAVMIPLFPVSGMRDIVAADGAWANLLDVGHHLVLPAFSLGVIYLAMYSRTARASMQEVLSSDYIRTARAKGLGERAIVGKHALRNAMLPVVTLMGLQVGSLISGAVLVEAVFDWPGLGTLALDSILRRDTPVLLGILAMTSVLVVVANLLTDLSYRFIDPRIRVGGGQP